MSDLLFEGPSGAIGPALVILGEGDDVRIRIGTLARLMRISRQTLWRIATKRRMMDARGLVRVADVRAISDDYDARILALLDHARAMRDNGQTTSIARLERIEKAIEHIGAFLGLHAWSGTPTGK
jgi:hypothetical protein